MRDSLSFQAEDASGLAARRNLELMAAMQSRHFNFCPKRRLREVDGQTKDNIIAASSKEVMRCYRNCHVKIAPQATLSTSITLTVEADLQTVIDSRRNPDLNSTLLLEHAVAPALGTGIVDYLSSTVTLAAHRRIDEASEDTFLHAPHLPRAVTRGAPRR